MALALPGVSNFEQKDPVKRKLCHFLGVLLPPSNPSLQKVSMPHAVDSALRGDRGFALQKIICETPEPGPNRPPPRSCKKPRGKWGLQASPRHHSQKPQAEPLGAATAAHWGEDTPRLKGRCQPLPGQTPVTPRP